MRLVWILGIVLVLCGRALGETTGPASPSEYGKVIPLTPMEVSAESMEFAHWLKVETPHVLLYTDAGEKEATRLVRQMEMMHQATQFFLHRRATASSPVLVILPTRKSDWKKIKSKGNVEWEVATTLCSGTRRLLLAEYDWQNDGMHPVWGLLGIDDIRAMNLEGPTWFTVGLSGFFGNIEFGGDSMTLGKQGMDGVFLKSDGWMPWPSFFRVTSSSPEFVKEGRTHHQYRAQCAALVHYLLTHADRESTARLLAWAAYLNAGNEPTEEAFVKVFKMDYRSLQKQIEALWKGGRYNTGTIQFPPAALEFRITRTTPAPREMRELFVLAQVCNQKTPESAATLDALLARGLKTESLRELLSDACFRRDRRESGLKELRTLISGGSTNPAVYSEAAAQRMNGKVADWTPEQLLGDEVEEIRSWCRRALELEPLHVPANETLAWAEALAPLVTKENVDAIARICKTLDGNAPTDRALAALAVARWRAGALKQSKSVAERILQSPYSRKEPRAQMKLLLAKLDSLMPAVPSQAVAPGDGAPEPNPTSQG